MSKPKKPRFDGVDIDRVHQQFRYRDPLEILIRQEEKLCKGCAHVTEVLGKGYCAKKEKAAVKRCRDYKDRE